MVHTPSNHKVLQPHQWYTCSRSFARSMVPFLFISFQNYQCAESWLQKWWKKRDEKMNKAKTPVLKLLINQDRWLWRMTALSSTPVHMRLTEVREPLWASVSSSGGEKGNNNTCLPVCWSIMKTGGCRWLAQALGQSRSSIKSPLGLGCRVPPKFAFTQNLKRWPYLEVESLEM